MKEKRKVCEKAEEICDLIKKSNSKTDDKIRLEKILEKSLHASDGAKKDIAEIINQIKDEIVEIQKELNEKKKEFDIIDLECNEVSIS